MRPAPPQGFGKPLPRGRGARRLHGMTCCGGCADAPVASCWPDVLVLAGLAAFVVLVYVVVVLGGGALIGQTSSPDVALSVLATAVVALGFDPVQTRLEQLRRAAGARRPALAVRRAADGSPRP